MARLLAAGTLPEPLTVEGTVVTCVGCSSEIVLEDDDVPRKHVKGNLRVRAFCILCPSCGRELRITLRWLDRWKLIGCTPSHDLM